MWQRIQTVFLLIAAAAALIFLFLPIAHLNETSLYVKDNMIVTAISIAIVLLSLFTISQFKDRKLQIRFCGIIMSLAFGLIAACIYITNSKNLEMDFLVAAGIPVIMLIATFLAQRNIKKDEALVKSMDRFR